MTRTASMIFSLRFLNAMNVFSSRRKIPGIKYRTLNAILASGPSVKKGTNILKNSDWNCGMKEEVNIRIAGTIM